MEKTITITPKGVCSRQMLVTLDGDVITNLSVIGGCRGNLQGVAALIRGMKVEEAISRLEGIQCHNGTSCPDQLAQGLKQMIAEEAK